MSASSENEVVHAVAHVSGLVQGVGYRWWTRYRAGERGVHGSAVNLADSRVEVHLEGDRTAVEALLVELGRGPGTARVSGVDVSWQPPSGLTGFDIG